MTKEFPRVLVIGVSFETTTGSGITLTNQFKNWDYSKLAAAAENIYSHESICRNNYQLGYSENKRRFPFNLIQKKNTSGRVNFELDGAIPQKKQTAESYLKKAYLQLLHFTGLYHYSRSLLVSEPFKKWILEFRPDYIYSTVNEPEVISFVKEIQKITQAKIITHIWDDLIKNYFNRPGLFYNYRKNHNTKEFIDLLEKSSIRLCISPAMGTEYYKRYGKVFEVFHNCLDFNERHFTSKEHYQITDYFTILYAGRIGIGISDCLLDVCEAIEKLGLKKIEFHIQTTSSHIILEKLKKYEFVKIRPVVDYDAIPGILANADLLLMPYNFDRDSIESLRLSMPTKIPEYMISGTPILLYADEKMYLTQFARENDIAYVLTNNTVKEIGSAIESLVLNEELRAHLGNNARNYAVNHFSATKVRSDFAELLCSGLKEGSLTENKAYSL